MSEKRSLYAKIFDPKIMRILIYAAMLVFLPGIVVAYIVAVATGGTWIPPGAYNMVDNYISDLGSVRFTAAPFILDTIHMTTAIIMVPVFLYTKNLATEYIEKYQENSGLAKFSKITNYLGLISLFIGAFGLFSVGLFSEDRDIPPGSHYFFLIVVFGGFCIGAFLYGWVSVLNKTYIPKILGFFMIVGPFTSVILFLVKPAPFTEPALEWVMLFCIFFWMIPVGIYLLKLIKENEKKE
jgi:hypothetical protein